MRCKNEVHEIGGEHIVVGITIKADSKADRRIIRALCLDHPKSMVSTSEDYEYATIRLKGHEYRT